MRKEITIRGLKKLRSGERIILTVQRKNYILKKDCPNLGKEIGDYYNNEYGESIEELIKKGIIEEEIIEESST